jgi:hypothetical protein
MSLSRAEVPGSDQPEDSGGNEALPKVTKLNRGLYALVFYILGTSLLVLIAGWILIAALGKTVPEGIPVVVGAIVGGLTGVVAVNGKTDAQ